MSEKEDSPEELLSEYDFEEPWAGADEGEEWETESSASADMQDEEDDAMPSSIALEIQSGSISTTGSIKQAGILIERLNLLSDSIPSLAVKLSAQHFRAWDTEMLARCEAELVFDDLSVSNLSRALEEKRFLIISGDPESGKGSTGLLMASSLVHRNSLKGVLSRQGLDAAVSVDLDEISGATPFTQRVVLIEDALSGENPDLVRLLRTFDPIVFGLLTERLRRNRSAIILTAATHTIETFKAGLENLGILHWIDSAPLDLRRVALRRLVERLPLAGASRERLLAFLATSEADLARELVTVPKIVRFVREYFKEVAEERLSIRQALGRMDDLSQWVMNDLAGDLDAQAAALALVICSAAPSSVGVPWFTFDQLRRRILDRLRQELRVPDNQPLSLQELGCGPLLLERARARVVDLPAPLPDLVQFKDDRYPQWLWQVLLGSGRSLATVLLPLLYDLAEEDDAYLRASAACALGRLGQIDPLNQAVPCLQNWITGSDSDRAAAFLQGAIASTDRGYWDFCLIRVRQLAVQRDAISAAAAVRSLRLIGRPDPAVPLAELRRIAQQRLSVQTELLRQVASEVAMLEEAIRRKTNLRRVSAELRALHLEVQKLMAPALVSPEQLPVLGAFQYSLAGILFAQGGNPGPVLCEIRAWMKSEPEKLAPLIAYLFLHKKGLIDLLDRHKWISGLFGSEPCSRFLLSASQGPEEFAVVQEFLVSIFMSLYVFPGSFRFILEQRFLQVLRDWSQEACKLIGLRPTIVSLFSGLLDAQDPHLRKTIDRLLRKDPYFAAKGSRLRALAMDALNGSGYELIPWEPPRARPLPDWLNKRVEGSS